MRARGGQTLWLCRELSRGLESGRPYSSIPASAAADAALRSLGSVCLPREIEVALHDVVASNTSSRKHVRARGQALTDELKRMVRTKHRGGIQPNLKDEVPDPTHDSGARRLTRGKHRQRKRQLLSDLSGELHVPAALGALWREQSRGLGDGEGAQERPEEVAGRAATPFGADEGEPTGRSAFTLAQGPSSASVHDVEASIQSAPHTTTESASGKPIAALESAARTRAAVTTSATEARRRYDEAAALAYAGVRLPACYAALRRAMAEIAARLGPGWAPASMVDFGAGPGTATLAAQDTWPGGSLRRATAVDASASMAALGRALQSARVGDAPNGGGDAVWWTPSLGTVRRPASLVVAGYVLCELGSDAERAELVAQLWSRVEPGGVLLLVEPGTPAGSQHVLAARTRVLESAARASADRDEASAAAAHVLAPCPHDGACPLADSGGGWCHFTQRFDRTSGQRALKTTKSTNASGHADERFSYVALQRAPRGAAGVQPRVRAEIPLTEDVLEAYRQLPASQVPRRARAQLGLPPHQTSRADAPGDSRDPLPNHTPPETVAGGPEEMLRNGHQDDDLALFDLAQSRGLLRDLDAETQRLIRESLGEDQDLFDEVFQEGDGGDGDGNIEEHGPALLSGGYSDGDQPSSVAGASMPMLATTAPGNDRAVPGDDDPAAGSEEPSDPETVARHAAASWARVVRPPLKKGGHVVLDLCSAADDCATRGELVRQVVARLGSEQRLGGRGAYRLARSVVWGDLWPADYQHRLPVSRVHGTAEGSVGANVAVADEGRRP